MFHMNSKMTTEEKIKLFQEYQNYLEEHPSLSSHGFDVLEHSSKRVLCTIYANILNEGGELSDNGDKLLNEAKEILQNEIRN